MKIRSGFVSNSSSSSFVCNTKLSKREVENKMEQMKDFYNALYKDSDYVSEFSYTIHEYTKKDDVDEIYSSWEDYYSSQINAIKNNIKNNGKCIVINSEGDNSIPYQVFELIEDLFKADRMQLG